MSLSPSTSRVDLASHQGSSKHSRDRSHLLKSTLLMDADVKAWAFLPPPGSLATAAPSRGALAGLLIGVKDVIDVAGMPTRCGSAACPQSPVAFDASCVAMLRAAGAVPIGKTVTTEFAFVTPGATRNPANLSRTPGGSSSGSAAAVAAGMVPVTLGTQTGGSMIRPASYCGVVGFKPSFGAVARDGMKVMCESLDVIGWFGRDVSDVDAVARVLLPWQRTPARVPKTRARIAFLNGNPGHVLQPEAGAELAAAARRLESAGWTLQHMAAFKPAASLLEAYRIIMHYEFARSLLPVVQSAAHLLSRPLLAAVETGLSIPSGLFAEAKSAQSVQRLLWDDYVGDADLILTSSTLGPAPAGLAYTGDSAFNKGWSVLGWPCLHLPTSRTDSGLPLGVQIVGRPGEDIDLLEWGAALHSLLANPRAPVVAP